MKNNTITVRLSDLEKDSLQKKVEERGTTISQYVRQLIREDLLMNTDKYPTLETLLLELESKLKGGVE